MIQREKYLVDAWVFDWLRAQPLLEVVDGARLGTLLGIFEIVGNKLGWLLGELLDVGSKDGKPDGLELAEGARVGTLLGKDDSEGALLG
eukprot:scaffold44576_cov161-Skeletonema_marinoi.AAC.1